MTFKPELEVTQGQSNWYSQAALHCCKALAKINRKVENSTPCKIVTHEDFDSNLTHVITSWTSPTMQLLGRIGRVGASAQIGEIQCVPKKTAPLSKIQ